MARGPTIRKASGEVVAPPAPPSPAKLQDGETCIDCGIISIPTTNLRCRTCYNKHKKIEAAKRKLLEPAARAEAKQVIMVAKFRQQDAEMVINNLRRWRKEPWTFVRELFGAEPDFWQDEALHALTESGFDKICLKACKGPGKTCFLAWAGLWFLTCFENPKIICTSITAENLKDGLWTEFAYWLNKAEVLKRLFQWQSERIFLKEQPELSFISARTWPKDADKTKQASTLAGIHGTNTMLIIDEAGDIPEGVVAAGLAHHSTQGAKKETHITLMAGNPTRLDGALGTACTRDAGKWWIKEITGDPDDPKRAKRIDIKWARDEIEKWGRDSAWALVNVFGKFPPTQDNKMLGPEIVRAAMDLVLPEAAWRKEPRVMGLDVARSLGSDRSVLCRRQGGVVFPFTAYRLDDTSQLVSQVAFEASKFKPKVIFVDATGVGGPVADRLIQLGLNVIMVYFGNPADDRRFADKRSEIWWRMCQEIKGNGGVQRLALPGNMPELVADLTGPEIKFDQKGKLRLESKESLKKRGFKSPDTADALACTFASPVFEDMDLQNHGVRVEYVRRQTDYDPYTEERAQADHVREE